MLNLTPWHNAVKRAAPGLCERDRNAVILRCWQRGVWVQDRRAISAIAAAYVRHRLTHYDTFLLLGMDKQDARRAVGGAVAALIAP